MLSPNVRVAFLLSAINKLLCLRNEVASSPGGISGVTISISTLGDLLIVNFLAVLVLVDFLDLGGLLNSLKRLLNVSLIAFYISSAYI